VNVRLRQPARGSAKPPSPRLPRRSRSFWTTKTGVANLFLLGVVFLALYPFFVMLFGGFKTAGELSLNPAGIPADPTVANYEELFGKGGLMLRALFNSAFVTVLFTIITVVFCALAGYAFAKYDFRGKNAIFAILIASMLVPAEVNLPTLYIFFSRIGWLNTYQVQILPGTASVLGMFMARQFMQGLPNEVLESARVDGAGHWRVFWQIALPMSTPVLGAIAILLAVQKWADYLWPRILINEPEMQPVMVMLPQLSAGDAGTFIIHYEILLAGAVIITLPILLVFLKFQDQLMTGTTAGAVKS
jgi:ABC-type glycerol-3-phosphate transport system permease component